MLTLAKGALFARIVGLASIPILTRIYSPEEFGVLALYTALVAILAPVLTLRYVQAIPLPKTDTMAINLFFVCLKLIFWGTFIIAVAFALFASPLLDLFNMQALVAWWPLIMLGVTGTALYELFSMWATRKRQYKILATTQLTQSLMGSVTKIILGLLAFKTAGLLLGQVIAQSAGIGSFIKQSPQDFRALKQKVSKRKTRFIVRYYRDFPYYRLPSQFLMVLALQAPVLLMAAIYNKEYTGQLGLAVMAISLPVNLIGQAAAKAYYSEIAILGKNNLIKIRELTYDLQKKLFMVGIPTMLLSLAFVAPAFKLIFGEEWERAGWYATILMPYILFKFTSSPLEQLLNITSRQYLFLIINLARSIGFLLIFFVGNNLGLNDYLFVGVISAYLMFYYCFMTVYILRTLRVGI